MTEADEIFGIIKRICPVVLSAAVTPTTTTGSAMRRMVGMMAVDYNMINLPTFSMVLGMCLDLARRCSATLPTMDRVRKQAMTETPVTFKATQFVLAIVRLTLACEGRILAAMTFRSRDEVDAIARAVNTAFEQAALIASDDLDANTYMAIIRLHGDITRFLSDSGRVLPRVINYEYQIVMPAYRMSHQVYADPLRATELINENAVVHPAFMPLTGKMLAV